MSDSNQKISFWETIPGIITAIGALLTGVAALITALYTSGIIVPAKPATSSPKAKTQAAQTETVQVNEITTGSGLHYRIIKKGKGDKPMLTDTVKVHYRGILLDGTEFDSTYKRNIPITFRVNHVISGLREALQLMPVGSKYILYLPPKLAYGDRGAPPVIAPGSTLIFEVELIEIVNAPKKKKAQYTFQNLIEAIDRKIIDNRLK